MIGAQFMQHRVKRALGASTSGPKLVKKAVADLLLKEYCQSCPCIRIRASQRLQQASMSMSTRQLTRLHRQTHWRQLKPHISIFAGQLTYYTTKYIKISHSLTYYSSKVNLRTTSPEILASATASHINIRGPTYHLQYQTHRHQLQPHIDVCRLTYPLHRQTR